MTITDSSGRTPLQAAVQPHPRNRDFVTTCMVMLLATPFETFRNIIDTVPFDALPPNILHRLLDQKVVIDRYEKCMLMLGKRIIRMDAIDEFGKTVLHAAVELGSNHGKLADETKESKRKAGDIFRVMQDREGFGEARRKRDPTRLTPFELALKCRPNSSSYVSVFVPTGGRQNNPTFGIGDNTLAIMLTNGYYTLTNCRRFLDERVCARCDKNGLSTPLGERSAMPFPRHGRRRMRLVRQFCIASCAIRWKQRLFQFGARQVGGFP